MEEENKNFQEALTDFVRNFGYGDAIRHLVDKGYTTSRIIREFNYPLSADVINKYVNERLEENVTKKLTENDEVLAYVKSITEADYGCEEMSAGSEIKARVILWKLKTDKDETMAGKYIEKGCYIRKINDSKDLIEVIVEIEDRWLVDNFVEEGTYVTRNHTRLIKYLI